MTSVVEVCTNAVRGCLVAPPDKKLVVADLSNIEGRVCAWLAGEEWKLEAFREYDRGTGPDLYKLVYARSFGKDPADVTKDERQIGKVMELALGFGGAVGAFTTMAANYGVELPEDEVVNIVKAWRKAHPRIKSLWYSLEGAFISAMRDVGASYRVGLLEVDALHDAYDNLWVRIKLPSGRYLSYLRPELYEPPCKECNGEGTVEWLEKTYTCFECGGSSKSGKHELSYEGQNSYTKKWERLYAWGGLLVENCTQSFARDVFMAGFRRAEAAGWPVVLRVHDELVCEVPDSPEFTGEALSALMTEQQSWTLGLPLAAAGGEMYRYAKAD